MKTKKIMGLLLGLLLIGTIAFAQPPDNFEPGSGRFKPGSEPDGFRGMKWGTDISTLPGIMKYVDPDPSYKGMEAYKKKNDKLKIGGAVLKSISYASWKGKFEDVFIEFDGFVAWASLKEAVFAEFGEGHQEIEHFNGYVWFGKTTAMILRYDESSKEGAYCLFSTKIRNQQDEYKKQKAKERIEKGF